MSTLQKPRARVRRPHQRSVVVVRRRPAEGAVELTVKMVQDGKSTFYRVLPLASDFGLAYRVSKPAWERDQKSYDVLFEEGACSCNCPAGTYHGYCIHADGLQALQAAGKLPLPPVAVAQTPEPDLYPNASYKPGASSDLAF